MTDLRDISGLIREQQTEIERLALWKQDIEAQTAIVMDEECGTDERHCTCVPILRREVERLRGAVNVLIACRRNKRQCHICLDVECWENTNEAARAAGGEHES